MAITNLSHLSLTVSDLDVSKAWYSDVLSWSEQVTGRSDTTSFAYGILPGDVVVVLRQHDEPAGSTFDERRPGLDHLSLMVSGRADLEQVETRLRERGGVYTPTVELPFAHQLTFRDPDNIALELMCAL
jgi:glyoxylase I family protein